MKFTIAPSLLENLVKAVCSARAKKKENLTLKALNGRLIVECNGIIAACDSSVIEHGAVTVHARSFRKVLDTFKGTPLLEVEAGAGGLRIQSFRMGIVSYDANPELPAE